MYGKRIVTGIVFSIFMIPCLACDICGSGAGGGYLGLLPGFKKRFISLRYTQNALVSHLGPGGTYSYLTTDEKFKVAEIWGAANIGKKFRVAVFVPVNFLERANSAGRYVQSGMGDIIMTGYYQVMNKQKSISGNKLLVQSLWIGGGLKLPTGEYNTEEKNVLESTQNTFQLGTGSVDFSLHAMYDIRLQDAGINVNTAYKANKANAYDYRYGNKFTMNVLAYYKIRVRKKFSFAPNTGVLFESSAKDHMTKEIEVWETGGHSLMGITGLEFAVGSIGLGMNYQTPLSQSLGEGKVKAKGRGMVYVSLSF